MSPIDRPLVGTIILAVGIATAGLLADRGSVRAERKAKATLAIWPLGIVAAKNDLAQANTQLQRRVDRIKLLLARHGVDSTQATRQEFAVRDGEAEQYGNRSGPRDVITQSIMVRSRNPDAVAAAVESLLKD